MNSEITLRLRVNGQSHEVLAHPAERLLDVLRDRLGLTGAKEGCATGQCGACTVLMDGRPVASCMMFAADAAGRDVTTIEGLAPPGELHPIQSAFLEHGAVQCGFCTPGMVLAAKALLDHNPSPSDDEIRRALTGNLCRCTGYRKIFDAIKSLAPKSLAPKGLARKSPAGKSLARRRPARKRPARPARRTARKAARR